MGTKTIELSDDVYECLKARKREDESFTELMNRLLDEVTSGWREGFGTLETADADELDRVVNTSRQQMSAGLAARQQQALDDLSDTGDADETG